MNQETAKRTRKIWCANEMVLSQPDKISIGKESLKVGLVKVAGYGSFFLYWIWIPRTLGVTNYGIFSFISTSIILFFVFNRLGINLPIFQEIPKYIAQKEVNKAKGIVRSFLRLRIASFFPFILFWIFFLHSFFKLDLIFVFLGGLGFVLRSMNETIFSIIRGEQKIALWATQDVLRPLLGSVLIVMFFSIFSLVGAFFALTVAEIIILLLGVFSTKSFLFSGNRKDSPPPSYFLRTSINFYFIGLFLILFLNSGIYLIQLLLHDYDLVAYYSIGMTTHDFLSSLFSSLGFVLFPAVVILDTYGQEKIANRVMIIWWKRLIIMFLPLSLWVFFLIRPLILLFLGEAYLPASFPSRIFVIGAIFRGTFEIFRVFVMARKELLILLKSSLVSLILFYFLSFYLIPLYALVGVAIAFIVAEFIATAYLVYASVKKFSLILPWRNISLLSVTTLCLATIVWLINCWTSEALTLTLTTVTIIYIAFLIYKGELNKNDLIDIFRAHR